MKFNFFASTLLCFFSVQQFNVFAQAPTVGTASTVSQPVHAKTKGYNKGHFVLGTNLLNYVNSSYSEKDYVNKMQENTLKNSFNNISFSVNIWAGYFVSDKVCVGLNFNDTYGNSSPLNYPYNVNYYGNYGIFSTLIPTNLFFRYYILSNDSGLVNVFLEGIVGGSYSSGTYNLSESGMPAEVMPITETAINTNINAALSLNASKHFAVQFKVGFIASYQDYKIPAYMVYGQYSNQLSEPEEAIFSSFSFIGTVGLQYKL